MSDQNLNPNSDGGFHCTDTVWSCRGIQGLGGTGLGYSANVVQLYIQAFLFCRGNFKVAHKNAHHAGCISACCQLQNGVLRVRLSGSRKESSGVLNWDCRENKGEKMEGAHCHMSNDG